MLLAPLGTKTELLAALDQAAADVQELVAEVRPRIGHEYLHGEAPFQEHLHVRAFVFDFLSDFGLLVERWAERTGAEVEPWPDVTAIGKQGRALEIIGAALERDRPA